MKIWNVVLATEDGSLGDKLVAAANYRQAIDIVEAAAIAGEVNFIKLTKREKKTLHVEKVELYCETDAGK